MATDRISNGAVFHLVFACNGVASIAVTHFNLWSFDIRSRARQSMHNGARVRLDDRTCCGPLTFLVSFVRQVARQALVNLVGWGAWIDTERFFFMGDQ